MDFSKLSAAEVNALDGFEREAWYSYARGDKAEAARILSLYTKPAAAVAFEADEEPAAPVLTSKELQAAKRAAARAARNSATSETTEQ